MSEVGANTELSKKSTNDETTKSNVNNQPVGTVDKQNTETMKVASEDVQRAIEGLAEIPDDELQEFFDDKDVVSGFDIIDDIENSPKPSKTTRTKEREHRKPSREYSRRDRKSPPNRERLKRDERRRDDARRDDARREDTRRDDTRRDPSKSSKDIERDKMRTKKDTASKMLAEKEKAIKHLLDSDNIVPPGTEVEAIQDITEKQRYSEHGRHSRGRKSRERRRSPERQRFSPARRRSNDWNRSSLSRSMSDERRQTRLSPEYRRNWGRRGSRDRSLDRHRRREEREQRLVARRSRSRDRQRSRSPDRYRKRWSRSPLGRRSSPRRYSRSRTPERRPRKRSPFINELARQFATEDLIPGGTASTFLAPIPPLMSLQFMPDQGSSAPPPSMPPYMHHPGPPGPSAIHMETGQPFLNFGPESHLGPPMNFDQGRGPPIHPPQPDYVAGTIMYNQGNQPMQPPILGPPILSMPIHSPQPVPAPMSEHPSLNFSQGHCAVNIPNLHHAAYNGSQHTERSKTPEPPIISNSKPFEKTSLSSLLEASVSAKEALGHPILYPGFKPEILRQCELALRDLPTEDIRFKTKGRFFFDPSKEDLHQEPENLESESILLRTARSKIYWEEMTEGQQSIESARTTVDARHKTCQTEPMEMESKGIQATVLPKTVDFCVQVYPNDIQQAVKDMKRPIIDRLDWNTRESYEIQPRIPDDDDLRWSLTNSSQKRRETPWNRTSSPPRIVDEHVREPSPRPLSHERSSSRGINVASTTRAREHFSYNRSTSKEHYSRERFSPVYGRSTNRY